MQVSRCNFPSGTKTTPMFQSLLDPTTKRSKERQLSAKHVRFPVLINNRIINTIRFETREGPLDLR